MNQQQFNSLSEKEQEILLKIYHKRTQTFKVDLNSESDMKKVFEFFDKPEYKHLIK